VYGDTNAVRSINFLFRSTGRETKLWPTVRHNNAWQELRKGNISNIKWVSVLDADTFKLCIMDHLGHIWRTLDNLHDTYYTREFLCIRELLAQLSVCKVDKQFLRKILKEESRASNKKVIESFTPDESGFLPQITYNQSGSVTGRLTITDGPMILTLKKEHRPMLRSRFVDGNIVQIDFVSLEPRIILSHKSDDIEDDIYSSIAETIFMNSLPRSVVKNFTLRVIYGSSLSTLKEVVSSWSDEKVRCAQRDIKAFFGISSIVSKLKKKIKETGTIENLYRRTISPTTDAPHVLFNNYIQSSASDAALLGFKELCEKIKSENIRANLIFIIHDAIILDVHPDSFQKLKSISEDGVSVLNSEIKFPLSFEIIS